MPEWFARSTKWLNSCAKPVWGPMWGSVRGSVWGAVCGSVWEAERPVGLALPLTLRGVPLARLIPRAVVAGFRDSSVRPDWVKSPEVAPDPESIDRLAATAGWLRMRAEEERDLLLALKTLTGRPTDLAGDNLARQLASIWHYCGGDVTPPDRGAGLCPFLDFLQAVGRTVDREFSGEGPAKKVVDALRAARREGGGPPRRARRP